MIELQCLNYLFIKNSLQFIILNGIDESYFTTYREHFIFIRDFYNKPDRLNEYIEAAKGGEEECK